METYLVIRSANDEKLARLVINKIKEGYMPIGGVAVNDVGFYQAMVYSKGLREAFSS